MNLQVQYNSIKIITIFFYFFDRNGQADTKIHKEMQGTRIVKILKTKVRRHTPNIKTYWKTIEIKHQDRHRDQWNRTESTNVNLYIDGQLIFNKVTETIWCERTVFSTNGTRATGYPSAEELSQIPYLIPHVYV